MILAESTIVYWDWKGTVAALILLGAFLLVVGAPIAFRRRPGTTKWRWGRLYVQAGLALFIAGHGLAVYQWWRASDTLDFLGPYLRPTDIAIGAGLGLWYAFVGWSALGCLALSAGLSRLLPRWGPWLSVGIGMIAVLACLAVAGIDSSIHWGVSKVEMEAHLPPGPPRAMPIYEPLVPLLTAVCLLPLALGAGVVAGRWSRRVEAAGGAQVVTGMAGLLAVAAAGTALCGAWSLHMDRIVCDLIPPELPLPWSAGLLPPLVAGAGGLILMAMSRRRGAVRGNPPATDVPEDNPPA